MNCGSKRSASSAIRNVLLLVVLSGSCCLFIFKRQKSLEIQIEEMIARVLAVREAQSKLSLMHEKFLNDINTTLSNIKAQKDQIEVLEQSSKRYNLRFLGIPEGVPDDPLTLVRRVVEEKMGIKINEEIDVAFRVNEDLQPKPILVKFVRWKDKARILYRRKSLSSAVKVEEDLTDQQRIVLEQLRKIAKKAERQGQKIRWSGRQLFVDGELVKLQSKLL